MRNRIIFAAVAVIAIILIFVMVRSCAAGGTQSAENAQGAVQANANSAASVQVAQASSASASQASASASSASAFAGSDSSVSDIISHAAEEGRAERDAEFTVDPNRRDWNFESNGEKIVYLTFDDGPSENTQKVLDILDEYDCKATFFVVGHSDEYFPMIKEAYDRGHTIGLHSLTHAYDQVYASQQAYFEDLEGIGAIVKDQIGFVPCFIRFPGGSSNTVSSSYTQGIMSALVDEVQARGYQYYDWNASSGDGSDIGTEEVIMHSTVEVPPEYDNIILLMHDSATKQTTVEALPKVIEYYKNLGYEFRAIDRTSMVPHHGVNN